MKFTIISNQISKKNSRLKNRRGLAEIISTMMFMAITVTGATTLTYFVNDGFISGNLFAASSLGSSSTNILLIAYDTRDSFSLLTLTDVDNENIINPFLCAVTCSVTPNAIPESGGTEFIVLQIQNNGINSISLQDVTINSVVHLWDSSTSGIELDASINDLVGGKYPADGMFSLLPVGKTPIIQNENFQIQSGQIVNILIKLGPDNSDIQLNKGIHILLDTGGIHTVDFLIVSGDAR
ncbi:MAG: hypothetical protein QQN61_07875 [Nitrosopumilus sp.]